MIRKGSIFRFAMAGLMLTGVAGCASSPMRMPPTAAPAYGVAPVAPVPAPYAVQPVAPLPGPGPVPYAPAYSLPLPPTTPLPPLDAPAPATGIAGLTERQPDLCKASTYASSVGQPGSAIPGLGISRSYRVVEYRGIEPQDYDPNRLVFRLDATGTITKVDCG